MAIELSEKQTKNGWQIVKFGEIAKNISKRVEPSETDLKVYVGLEHLDPQSLRITRQGVPADVKGQKFRVRPGQIIFGKRHAYQKKVAVADFEGICSAHAMVLEEVVGKIIPGLQPFFMQSDIFMDRAVAISEGSLSPTIKWKTLAIQEFPLPPIERQKEILEALEKLEECEKKCIKRSLSGEILFSAASESTLKIIPQYLKDDSCLPSGWQVKKLREIAKVERGKFTPRPRNNPIYYGGQYPFVQIGDVKNSGGLITNHSQTLNDKGLAVSKIFPKGSILITIAANIGEVGLTTYETACTDSVVAIRLQANKEGEFTVALSNENEHVDLDEPWRRRLEPNFQNAKNLLAEHGLDDRWMINKSVGSLLQVEVIKLKAIQDTPYIVLKPRHQGLFDFAIAQRIIDINTSLVPDPMYRDFSSDRIEKALRTVGGKPAPAKRARKKRR